MGPNIKAKEIVEVDKFDAYFLSYDLRFEYCRKMNVQWVASSSACDE